MYRGLNNIVFSGGVALNIKASKKIAELDEVNNIFVCMAGGDESLSIGAALGSISIIIKHELVLFIIGFLFVIEACSVMLQVASFKLTGKRLFLMSPLHHHFEKKGWHENTIVIRFWILAVIFALIGLATLKLR